MDTYLLYDLELPADRQRALGLEDNPVRVSTRQPVWQLTSLDELVFRKRFDRGTSSTTACLTRTTASAGHLLEKIRHVPSIVLHRPIVLLTLQPHMLCQLQKSLT